MRIPRNIIRRIFIKIIRDYILKFVILIIQRTRTFEMLLEITERIKLYFSGILKECLTLKDLLLAIYKIILSEGINISIKIKYFLKLLCKISLSILERIYIKMSGIVQEKFKLKDMLTGIYTLVFQENIQLFIRMKYYLKKYVFLSLNINEKLLLKLFGELSDYFSLKDVLSGTIRILKTESISLYIQMKYQFKKYLHTLLLVLESLKIRYSTQFEESITFIETLSGKYLPSKREDVSLFLAFIFRTKRYFALAINVLEHFIIRYSNILKETIQFLDTLIAKYSVCKKESISLLLAFKYYMVGIHREKSILQIREYCKVHAPSIFDSAIFDEAPFDGKIIIKES